MAKFPDVKTLQDDYDIATLMDHLESMYIDTHNILFMAAILAICDEYGLPLNDRLAGKLCRYHLAGLLEKNLEGRKLERSLGLGKPGMTRKQFEDLWDPESPRLAWWYPQKLIALVDDTDSKIGGDINDAFRLVGKQLGYSESSVKVRYYHAMEGLDFPRRIDSPDFNNSYNIEYWNEAHNCDASFPTSRAN